MNKTCQSIIAIILLLLTGSHGVLAQNNDKTDPLRAEDNIYRHYTGTIGGRKAVLDLRYGYQGASNFGGSTYYYPDSAGSTRFYIQEPRTPDHDVVLTAREQVERRVSWPGNEQISEGLPAPAWEFRITGNKLTGKRMSGDRKDSAVIDFTEDYSTSAKLFVAVTNDTIEIHNKYNKKFTGGLQFITAMSHDTTRNDSSFISHMILKFLTHDTRYHSTQLEHHLGDIKNPYSRQLAADNSALVNDSLVEEKQKNKPASCVNIMVMPVYNDNGFLVFERRKSEGCMRIRYSDELNYMCLDRVLQKRLTLFDMLNIDTVRLCGLLEKAAMEQYGLSKKKLKKWLITDRVPVTGNVMLAAKGINFCYNDGEITPVTDEAGEGNKHVTIFLTYAQLGDMLKPEFKKRVGL